MTSLLAIHWWPWSWVLLSIPLVWGGLWWVISRVVFAPMKPLDAASSSGDEATEDVAGQPMPAEPPDPSTVQTRATSAASTPPHPRLAG